MRKTKPKKRILLPDPRYNDPYVTRFVNNLMLDGKKSVAYDIFYGAMDLIEETGKLCRTGKHRPAREYRARHPKRVEIIK